MKDTNAETEGKAVVVVTTREQISELVRAAVAEALEEHAPAERVDGLLDRAHAAKFLGVSLTTLDILARRESDPVPFGLVGDARRFDRTELTAWFRRQRGSAA